MQLKKIDVENLKQGNFLDLLAISFSFAFAIYLFNKYPIFVANKIK